MNTALSILIERLLRVLRVPFFTGWRTGAAVIPAMPWGWAGLLVWAGVCPCLPAAQRCAALESHYLHQFYALTDWCMDRFLYGAVPVGGDWVGIRGLLEREEGWGKTSCAASTPELLSLNNLCPWFRSARCFVPLLNLLHPGTSGSEGERLVLTRQRWLTCQHSSSHPSPAGPSPTHSWSPAPILVLLFFPKQSSPGCHLSQALCVVTVHTVNGSSSSKVSLRECH